MSESALSAPIRVLVCDADDAGLTALLVSLSSDARLSVRRGPAAVDELENAAELFAARVAVIGPRFPRAELEHVIRGLLRRECRTLIVADRTLDEHGAQLLLAGASGYLLQRDATPAALANAAVTVSMGATALHPDVVEAVFERWRSGYGQTGPEHPERRQVTLTSREIDVLRGLNGGLTNRALANELGIAEKTIEAHKSRLYVKLGARNQSHAVRIAAERGIL